MSHVSKNNIKKNLIWIDLEMTGLDINTCHIIEIAAIITDKNLNILCESPSIAIYQDNNILSNMNEWCLKNHNHTGLIKRVKKSKINVRKAEEMMINFVSTHCKKNESHLCGNSVWQDRKFLAKYMPKLENYFHYRILDVSSFKIAASLWKKNLLKKLNKKNTHSALQDIKESIKEMKLYKNHWIN